jgi:hypothetical protein
LVQKVSWFDQRGAIFGSGGKMGKLWTAAKVWWQGKKTIVGGCLVIAAGVAGVAYGKVDPVTGLGVVGFGLSIAGFSAKANRHQAELLTALQGVATAAVDIRSGNSAGAAALVEKSAFSLVPSLVTNSTAGDQAK